MKLSEIIELSEGTLLSAGVNPDLEINGGFGGDLMSDVLASIQAESVLITGLGNPQVVRTALIADVRLIIFARGKEPAAETLALAHQENIPVIQSNLGVYELSGRLYRAGLPSFEGQMKRASDND